MTSSAIASGAVEPMHVAVAWWRHLLPPRPHPASIFPLSHDLARRNRQIDLSPTDLAGLRTIAPDSVGKLEVVYLRVQRVMTGADLQYAQLLIGSALIAAHLTPDTPGRPEQIRVLLNGYATDIGLFLEAREQVSARSKYTKGLFVGVWLSAVVLGAVAFVALEVIRIFFGRGPTSGELFGLRDVVVAIGGGGAGAVVSVLMRLSGTTHIDYEAVTAGAARNRIMLGWFFAAAVIFLIKGGIVTVVTDPTAVVINAGDAATPLQILNSWFFWGAIGFLAGFNERWARSLITRSDDPPGPVPKAAAPPSGRRGAAIADHAAEQRT